MNIYDRFSPALLSICLRYCPDRATAEDMLHDAFLQAFRKSPLFTPKGEGAVYAWIRKITVNTCLMHLRKKDAMKFHEELDFCPVPEDEASDDLLIRLSDALSMEDLTDMIQSLPERERTVFNLYVFENWSHRQIAKALGIKERSSSCLLFRARQSLIKQIHKYVSEKTSR